MPYLFATKNRAYSDYASGHVFYSAPHHPAFPVRLISELFQRCQAIRRQQGLTNPVTIYDPCCGSAYHLSTLAYLHWPDIKTIIGSDIEAAILAVAARNLGLLTQSGLEKRAQEIADMQNQYGKSSHTAASQSAQRLQHQLQEYLSDHPIQTHLFQADATNSKVMANTLQGRPIDMVIADVPYGNQSNWQSAQQQAMPQESLLPFMLDALVHILDQNSIIAIATDKAQKCRHEYYTRLEQFQIGKRRITLLQLAVE
jgi:tRNA G10  N-methylase Trm11